MQIQKIIEQLGYRPNEAKVYLAALALGECHVSDIAEKVRLPRSSVQVIVDKLHKNGLINFYVKRRYKYWVAENPERLLFQLRTREERVRSILPALSALRKSKDTGGIPEVKVFTGLDQIKFIFDDIIETKHHILAIIPGDEFLHLFGENSTWEDFVEACVNHFLRIRILAPDTKTGRALAEEAGEHLREVHFLPERIGIQTAIFVYADKVALIMFNQKQPTALLIRDTGTRDTNTAFFEELWNRSSLFASGPTQGDRHATQESVLPEDNIFHDLADSSPQPLLIANENVEIEYVNKAWEKQFGYALAEVRGKNPRIVQSGKTPRRVYERMWKTLRAGKPFQSDEVIDRRKNGTLFNLMTTVFPIHSGGILRYIQILDDITERKRVEELRRDFLKKANWNIHPPLIKLHFLRDTLSRSREKNIKESADDLAAVERELIRLDRLTKELLDESS